jgi:hypothetical protein
MIHCESGLDLHQRRQEEVAHRYRARVDDLVQESRLAYRPPGFVLP